MESVAKCKIAAHPPLSGLPLLGGWEVRERTKPSWERVRYSQICVEALIGAGSGDLAPAIPTRCAFRARETTRHRADEIRLCGVVPGAFNGGGGRASLTLGDRVVVTGTDLWCGACLGPGESGGQQHEGEHDHKPDAHPGSISGYSQRPASNLGKHLFARSAEARLARMPVISVVSLKGGVGKTSVVLGLAGAATVRGLASLVVDLDPQGNATSLLSTDRGRTGAAAVFAHPTRATLEDAIAPCPWEVEPGEVDVLPSDPDLIRFDAWTGQSFRPRLARALAHLEGYDLVLIDCPPSLGALTREALAASDLAVIVTTPSYFGAQGVERAAAEIDEIRRSVNPELRLAGIVVNRVRSVAEEHQYREKELMSIYGRATVLKPFVPERIAVQQAEGYGQPVQLIKTAGGREVADIYAKLLTTLLRKSR